MDHAMRYFAMAIKAITFFKEIFIIRRRCKHKFHVNGFFVAADTILPDQWPGFFLHENVLPFHSKSELGSVVQTVSRFEVIFSEDVCMRDVAIIAGCGKTM